MSDTHKHAPDDPTDLAGWLWRVRRYEARIYVREQEADGTWESVSLADLAARDPSRWAFHVARMLEAGIMPVRVREESELQGDTTITQ